MSENVHDRALKLIAQARVEGMAETDSAWLRAHVEECGFCAEHARQIDRALRQLRTAAITLPDGLASRTQFRVRLRAMELRERAPRRNALWLTCAASWVFGVVSAPYVWSLLQWFGQRTGAPKLMLEIGFGLWWAIPALFAAVVLIFENARQSEEPAR